MARDLRLHWASWHVVEHGDAFGYARANRELCHGFERAGGVLDEHAETTLQMCTPDTFRPIPGRRNILYTMVESDNVPPRYVAGMARADEVMVPSAYNRDLLQPMTDRPVTIVPLGVDLDRFPGVARPWPRNRRFRWLWVGAANLRKGWLEVMDCWRNSFLFDARCELYVKTTAIDPEVAGLLDGTTPSSVARAVVEAGSIRRAGNITLDTRKLTDQALLRLYVEADGFVFAPMGEGWALTLLEAMATALPCVATIHTGMTAFADDRVVRSVRHESAVMLMVSGPGDPGHEVHVRRAVIADLAAQIDWIMRHPARARRLGVAAHRRAQKFSWDAAGRALYEAIGAGRGEVHAYS